MNLTPKYSINSYNDKVNCCLRDAVQISVVVSGGASSNQDLDAAKLIGASGMAAGTMFVFQRPHNAVLISYSKI